MFKKSISVLLALLLTFSAVALGVSAVDEGECNCGKPPLVYVEGQTVIYDDPSSPDRKAVPADLSADQIVPLAKPCIAPLVKGLITDKWDEYCDAFYDAIAPFYDGYGLSNEGTITNTSGPTFCWSKESISSNHSNNSVFTYEYRYDQRLDPWELADDLNEYIQAVKEKTNHSKVCLMSRCMGTAVAMAYLVKYGEKNDFADIYSYVYYDSTAMGFSIMDGVYTGQLAVDSKCASRYAMEVLGDDTVNEFLKATVDLMQKTYGVDLAIAAVENVYKRIYDNVVPRILRISYGTTPGYWGMVCDPYYEQAKDFVFGSQAADYAVLISKLDNYHENVQKRIPEVLLKLKNKGMSVGVVCKYGFQMVPVVAGADEQSDNLIDVYSQSLGATCSKYGEKLSDEYIKSAQAAGKGKYISPDREIDASTCLMPDNTWFVKNVEHMVMPQGVDPLLVAIARSATPMTVDSNPNFPQYMLYDSQSDSMSILTNDNCETRQPDNNYFQALIRFVKALFALIKEKLSTVFNPEKV